VQRSLLVYEIWHDIIYILNLDFLLIYQFGLTFKLILFIYIDGHTIYW